MRDLDLMIWLAIGLAIGTLGRLLMPKRDPGGFVVTALVGIAGALLAGSLGQALSYYGSGDYQGWIVAALGAAIMLVIYRAALVERTRR